MSPELAKAYRKERDKMWKAWANVSRFQSSIQPYSQARNALRDARIRTEWAEREDDSECPEYVGAVRLRVEADSYASLDDLEGDCFNPHANPDISPARLARERAAFIEKVECEGVWGIIGEYWDGRQWRQADSVWGFVGDDWQDSGYDIDIMSSALDAARECVPPGVEVFAHDAYAATGEDGEPLPNGWYWWSCLPGCLPDSEPNGPFETRAEAVADSQSI